MDLPIKQSSWVAIRILPSCHTNPIFVHVDDQPILADKKSVQWCVEAVKTCWNSKKKQIRPSEKEAAEKAYQRAEAFYRALLE